MNILPQIRDRRARDPCAVLSCIICASSKKGKQEEKVEADEEVGILRYMVTPHEYFISAAVFITFSQAPTAVRAVPKSRWHVKLGSRRNLKRRGKVIGRGGGSAAGCDGLMDL